MTENLIIRILVSQEGKKKKKQPGDWGVSDNLFVRSFCTSGASKIFFFLKLNFCRYFCTGVGGGYNFFMVLNFFTLPISPRLSSSGDLLSFVVILFLWVVRFFTVCRFLIKIRFLHSSSVLFTSSRISITHSSLTLKFSRSSSKLMLVGGGNSFVNPRFF